MRLFAFDVPEQGFDPGLIGRGVGRLCCWITAIKAMNSRVAVDVILGTIVRDREQDRTGRIASRKIQALRGDQLDQAFNLECVFEQHFDLG